MKKTGSIEFFEDVDLRLKFTFDDLMKNYGATTKGIKDILLDEKGFMKMDVLEELVEDYVNQKIKEKYGNNFSLDVMDDVLNISWNIDIKSIKEKHIEEWWNKKNPSRKPTMSEVKDAINNLIKEYTSMAIFINRLDGSSKVY